MPRPTCLPRPCVFLAPALALAACSTAPPRAYDPDGLLAYRASGSMPVERQSQEELAKQLANPVAALISLPFQVNYDRGVGAGDGERMTLNVQPVIPFDLDDDWLIISRTIFPLIDQTDVPFAGNDESGFGDTVQSFFFSPVEPTDSGWIWGAGPVFLLPTASEDVLGAEKLGIGPTAVALRQSGPWTYGALANHIVSVSGDDNRADVNATFLQPFVNYTTPTAWSYIANVEYTRDWEGDTDSLPVHLLVGKVTNIGGQLVQFTGGLRIWAESPPGGSDDLSFRFVVTPLFPR